MSFLKNEYALVLGGGGANGSYQMGAWKAFKKLGIKFNAVIGNSVGALNTALVIQDDFDLGLDLWYNITIDKIIALPGELLKDGKLHLTKNNLKVFRNFQMRFFKNKGLDTNPLKALIKKYIQEDAIRKSGVDMGLVTYQVDDLKPREIFLEDIPEGKLADYLLASASLPGFKMADIDGKKFVDGGVYDNLPYSMAKARGYTNIIIVDISGLGVNKKPDIEGTNTVYIKNSLTLGNILDFNPKLAKDYMRLGYYDTMKVFNKIFGIKYFYNFDKNKINELEALLFDKITYDDYSKYLKHAKHDFNEPEVKKSIRKILPKEFRKYRYIIISLMECAALSLDIERNKLYSFNDLVSLIWEKYNELEDKVDLFNKDKFKFFETMAEKIRKFNPAKEIKELFDFTDIKDVFYNASYKYEKNLEMIFGKNKKNLHTKALSNFFPNLLAAKIFVSVLKRYFKGK